MGNYNPSAPMLLGEQWVPIRNEDVVFSSGEDLFEQGHGFTIVTPETLDHGTYYVDNPTLTSQTQVISVYPRGTEALSGPVKSVVIPVSAATITGSTITPTTNAAVLAALASPSDGTAVFFTQPVTPVLTPSQVLQVHFATNSYPQLQGKRILMVNLLFNMTGYNQSVIPSVPLNFAVTNGGTAVVGFIADDSVSQLAANTSNAFGAAISNGTSSSYLTQPLQRCGLGEMTSTYTYPFASPDRMPWRYVDLQQLEASAGVNRLSFYLFVGGSGSQGGDVIRLEYMALEVIYCEEQRVAVGGKIVSGYTAAANLITLRSPVSNAANPVLAAGDYTVTESVAGVGNGNISISPVPPFNAARELYAIPPHPGYRIILTQTLGAQFVRESTHVLPQISLHASGGTITEPHVYGRQIAAPVYGSITATQIIYDDIVGVATSYPQVRYYARRFGNTTVPLTLQSINVTGAGITVSITPTDFDALPEILDGWREVTLRFATAPTMGTVNPDPIWQWSAIGELAGNQWQILGASAPAISGVPGNLLNQVPAKDLLGSATYQPPAGAATNLTWLTPTVTGVVADPATDAVLIFSQDPPTPSGFALTNLNQTVTGIGLSCGSLPCCIPSGIGYNQLTWSAASIAVSGFGAYELQRFDSVVGSFQTIMLTTAVAAVTGTTRFNDFEARVGVASVYRLRVLNNYNFAGAWSTQVTGTVPTPGIITACGTDGNSALIFTTNSAQSGSANLAYVMQWDSDNPAETFSLPEAGSVVFQEMYGRDGVVTFHGTERGLERFERVVLLQAGAISLPSLANANPLRNLAWANYPYVCVRDELGNRWYANVRIPGVTVQNNRQSYMAAVSIAETTQTPFAVSP